MDQIDNTKSSKLEEDTQRDNIETKLDDNIETKLDDNVKDNLNDNVKDNLDDNIETKLDSREKDEQQERNNGNEKETEEKAKVKTEEKTEEKTEDKTEEKKEDKKILKNIVLGGGGVRGLAYIGLLKLLEQNNLLENINVVVGSSAGSLMATSICLGYKSPELIDYLMPLSLGKFINITAKSILEFTKDYGLDGGEKLELFIKEKIKNKGFSEHITLKQLYDITKKHLIITASCIKNKQCIYLDYKTFPDMPVWLACRASCSLPILYKPITYQNYLLIDGGITDNIPLYKFEKEIENSVAFKFQSNTDLNNFIGYIRNISYCFKSYDPNRNMSNNIIITNLQNVEAMQMIDLPLLNDMMDACYQATKKKFIELKML